MFEERVDVSAANTIVIGIEAYNLLVGKDWTLVRDHEGMG